LGKLIELAQPILSGTQGAAYDASRIPEIAIDKLVYFGASVVWRASLKPWRVQKEVYSPIDIAPKYQEALRLFLLGSAPFPQNAASIVYLISSAVPPSVVVFPESLDEASARITCRFYIPGLWFFLLLGEDITSADRSMCILRSPSHPICLYVGADALPWQVSYSLYMNKREL
jgi:hypothetical protein